MIVVGNKCDMIKKREVELKDAKEITKNYGCPLLESSAKNDININEIFFSLIDQACSVFFYYPLFCDLIAN
jgi:Fe2+ transport system protein B